jgi:glyoxylase-like metal-dependent hydrolase (beta-lactamase superfamily II)
MATNCYIVGDDEAKECIVVDPASEAERILAVLEKLGLKATLVAVTHGHPDHTGAVVPLLKATGAPFAMHPADVPYLPEWGSMFGFMIPDFQDPPSPDVELTEGAMVKVGSLSFAVIETPGHTPGGICLYGEGVLLSGDTLFQAGIGRYDLPGGDGRRLLESIRTQLFTLPDETEAFPGHGEATTIGWEKRHNPFTQGGLPEDVI